MPVFEHQCVNQACNGYWEIHEAYFRNSEEPRPSCPHCRTQMERLASRFNAAWCQPMSYYNDKSKRGADADGHWGYNRDGSREYITTRQQQKAFVKRNGLVDPVDSPTNGVMTGKGVSGRGLPGAEI